MKVVLVANMYPTEAAPTFGVFVKNIADGLSSAGVDVRLVVMRDGRRGSRRAFAYALHYIRAIAAALSSKGSVTYVHFLLHHAPLLLALSLWPRRCVYVLHLHGSDLPHGKLLDSKLVMWALRRVISSARMVVAPSRAFATKITQVFPRVPEIFVSPSGGVNLALFRPDATLRTLWARHLNVDEQQKYILYVSRIEVAKGFDLLLDALVLLRVRSPTLLEGYKVLVVGNAADAQSIEREVSAKGLGEVVVLRSAVRQGELPGIFSLAEVLWFPSRSESLGLVAIEAMACAVPVVGARVGGVGDAVKDGVTGYSFDAGDAQECADALERYLALPEEAKARMREAARSSAAAYEVSEVSNALRDALERHAYVGESGARS